MRHSVVPTFTLLLTAFFLLLPSPVRACLNDRDSDTLASEAQRFPDALRVITGRFERNPPLFYEMRLRRVSREVAADPNNLALYDDAAVAYDRLGRDDEAIAWIEKKRRRLVRLAPNDPSAKEHWYRYYANVGTFRAHRWLRAGAKVDHIAEMQRARDDIAHALKIKPDAHFNREKYQLMAMEWIIVATKKGSTEALSDFIAEQKNARSAEKAVQGLSGLVVLGNAWESVDIFEALASELGRLHRSNFGYLAQLRCRELLASGRRSFSPEVNDRMSLYPLSHLYPAPGNTPLLEAKYKELRSEANAWQQRRTDYMMARLQADQHPDTDATFWNDYHETPAPSLDPPWSATVPHDLANFLVHRQPVLGLFCFLTALIGTPVVLWRFVAWGYQRLEFGPPVAEKRG